MSPAAMFALVAIVACGGAHLEAEHTSIPTTPGEHDFVLGGPNIGDANNAFIWVPAVPAPGRPWVMYHPTVEAQGLPSFAERTFYFQQFMNEGIAVAGADAFPNSPMGESYGGPAGRAVNTRLWQAMTAVGYSTKPAHFARSRGGLNAYNWAIENPTKVSAIAGIYPVGDIASFPGISPPNAELQVAYGLTTEAEFLAALPTINPVAAGRLAGLAAAGVPLYHVHGDSDLIVPIEDNSQVVKDRYDILAPGLMTLEIIPGGGHTNAPEFMENQTLADFVIDNA